MRDVANKSALFNVLIAEMSDSVLMRARLLSRAVTDIYDDKLRPFGITSARFCLLALIGHAEPATRSDIARLQHLDKSTFSRNLKAILSGGWVEEVRYNANGRSRPLALTAAGEKLLLNAQPAWLAAQAEAEALFGRDGMMAMIGTADRILNRPEISFPDVELEQENHQTRAMRRPCGDARIGAEQSPGRRPAAD